MEARGNGSKAKDNGSLKRARARERERERGGERNDQRERNYHERYPDVVPVKLLCTPDDPSLKANEKGREGGGGGREREGGRDARTRTHPVIT